MKLSIPHVAGRYIADFSSRRGREGFKGFQHKEASALELVSAKTESKNGFL